MTDDAPAALNIDSTELASLLRGLKINTDELITEIQRNCSTAAAPDERNPTVDKSQLPHQLRKVKVTRSTLEAFVIGWIERLSIPAQSIEIVHQAVSDLPSIITDY